jgi:dienelactone hydrolase
MKKMPYARWWLVALACLGLGCGRLINNLCTFRGDDYDESLPREKVQVPMADYFAPGYIFRPFKSAARYPAVVMGHTLGGSKDDQTNLLARRIARNGFLVLVIDLDGHGTNPHPFDDVSILNNLPRAIDYLFEQKDVDRQNIFVVGANLGAVLALKAGMVDWRIKGVVAIEALYRVDISIFQFIAETNLAHLFQPSQVRFSEDKGRLVSLINERLDKWDLLHSIGRVSPRPLLLVHAGNDGLIAVAQARDLLENAKVPKELKVYPDERHHTLLLNKDMTIYVVNWLKARSL